MLSLKKKMLMAGGARLRPQDVFATSLYTGNGGTQTITNGLDLAGKGGLVWSKRRSAALNHNLIDTLRSNMNAKLSSNTTDAEGASDIATPLSTGFSIATGFGINEAGSTYAAWAFRRAKKFFDIVTYTGNGQSGRQIPHGLGDVPGMIVVKRRDVADNWAVYHRRDGSGSTSAGNIDLQLNTTDTGRFAYFGASSSPRNMTATTFTVGSASEVNANGVQYVAYLFAHNPDLIDCGSYAGVGSSNGPAVTCGNGWPPQFVMIKNATGTSNWVMVDAKRAAFDGTLMPNSSAAEQSVSTLDATQTGFKIKGLGASFNNAGNTFIYLAIRAPT